MGIMKIKQNSRNENYIFSKFNRNTYTQHNYNNTYDILLNIDYNTNLFYISAF